MKAKGILFLFFLSVVKVAFSQDLERVDIDENITMKVPIDYNKVEEGDTLVIVAFSASGKLKIERFNLPSDLEINSEKVDGLKHYVQGYIKGMEFGVGLELFENEKGTLEGFQTRKIRYRINNRQRIIESYFLVLGQQIYEFQYAENSLLPSDNAQIIFSSISLK